MTPREVARDPAADAVLGNGRPPQDRPAGAHLPRLRQGRFQWLYGYTAGGTAAFGETWPSVSRRARDRGGARHQPRRREDHHQSVTPDHVRVTQPVRVAVVVVLLAAALRGPVVAAAVAELVT